MAGRERHRLGARRPRRASWCSRCPASTSCRRSARWCVTDASCRCRRSSSGTQTRTRRRSTASCCAATPGCPGLAFAVDAAAGRLPDGARARAGVRHGIPGRPAGSACSRPRTGSFDDLLALGFLSSMRREWRLAGVARRVHGQPRGLPTPPRAVHRRRGVVAARHHRHRSRRPDAAPPSAVLPYDFAMAYTLVLLRHGESDWNAKNLFTGWVDVALSATGRAEAVRGGQLLRRPALLPDVLHTSVLRRAITTADVALDAADRHWIPVRRSWRLNERHYGALQGKDKKADARGVRRGAVHALAPVLRRAAAADRPATTSSARPATPATPSWATTHPRPSASRTSSRGCCRTGRATSSRTCAPARRCWSPRMATRLRALVKHLDGISDEAIAALNIPTGIPLSTGWTTSCGPVRGWGVPRPRGRQGRDRRGGQPGPLTAHSICSAAQLAS